MDDVALSALVGALSGLAGGAMGEAGGHAWRSFEDLVRRHFGRKSVEAVLAEQVGQGDVGAIEELARVVAVAADEDTSFAQAVRQLLGPVMQGEAAGVRNQIAGDVSGTAIQARDITTINLSPE